MSWTKARRQSSSLERLQKKQAAVTSLLRMNSPPSSGGQAGLVRQSAHQSFTAQVNLCLCVSQGHCNKIAWSSDFASRPKPRRAAAVANHERPSRPPDAFVEEQTSPDLAALYRLTGDENPLHIDPEFAALGGYPRPILHGLCTFGIAGKHVLKKFGNGEPGNLKSIKARLWLVAHEVPYHAASTDASWFRCCRVALLSMFFLGRL